MISIVNIFEFRLKLLPCPKYWLNNNIEDLDGECWKSIPDYDGLYLASNYGRIKSLKRPRIKGSNAIRDRVLRPGFRGKYLKVDLWNFDYTFKTISVHRLIGLTFHDNPENKSDINHKDLIKTNNWALNLEWNTKQENLRHCIDAGRDNKCYGEKHGKSKLLSSQVLEIFYMTGPISEIAKKFGVHRATVHDIKKGRKWYRITGAKKTY